MQSMSGGSTFCQLGGCGKRAKRLGTACRETHERQVEVKENSVEVKTKKIKKRKRGVAGVGHRDVQSQRPKKRKLRGWPVSLAGYAQRMSSRNQHGCYRQAAGSAPSDARANQKSSFPRVSGRSMWSGVV